MIWPCSLAKVMSGSLPLMVMQSNRTFVRPPSRRARMLPDQRKTDLVGRASVPALPRKRQPRLSPRSREGHEDVKYFASPSVKSKLRLGAGKGCDGELSYFVCFATSW